MRPIILLASKAEPAKRDAMAPVPNVPSTTGFQIAIAAAIVKETDRNLRRLVSASIQEVQYLVCELYTSKTASLSTGDMSKSPTNGVRPLDTFWIHLRRRRTPLSADMGKTASVHLSLSWFSPLTVVYSLRIGYQ